MSFLAGAVNMVDFKSINQQYANSGPKPRKITFQKVLDVLGAIGQPSAPVNQKNAAKADKSKNTSTIIFAVVSIALILFIIYKSQN